KASYRKLHYRTNSCRITSSCRIGSPSARSPRRRIAGMATTDSGLSWEARLWAQGVLRVAGVDEAGRGALAGPVVAAAVLLRPGRSFSSLFRDSKTLSPRQRDQALREIEAEAWAIGIGVVEVETIEAINIKQASRLAMRQAVEALNPSPEHLLVD